MATVWQDCRYAARSLRKETAFTLVAVLTLAVGIGANTAIFSLVQTLIYKAPAFEESDRVVTVWRSPKDKVIQGYVSYLELQDWRRAPGFEGIAGYKPINVV